jgi:hypothetical protein
MSETPALAPPLNLPDGYREVLYWRITGKPSRMVLLQLFSVPLFIIFGWIFCRLSISLRGLPGSLEFNTLETAALVIGIPITYILHELAHGWVMRFYGARPRYGVMWRQFMFYATSPGFAYRRNAYLAVALAPLVALSLLAVLGMLLFQGTFGVVVFALCAVVNGSGAVGDLWITAIVLRFPARAYVIDERDGVRVFLPEDGA